MSEPTKIGLQAVSKVAVAAQVTDVQIFLGATQFSFDEKGAFQQPMVNFFAGYSLSPIAAQNLAIALTSALRDYEERFGTIPRDPGQTMDTTGPMKV